MEGTRTMGVEGEFNYEGTKEAGHWNWKRGA